MKKKETLNIARALLRALSALPEKDRAGAVAGYVRELHAQGKLPDASALVKAVERVWTEVFGVRIVQFTTAHRVSTELKERVAQALPHAEIRAIIDPRLVGGAQVRIDDRVIDGSVQGMFERMKKTLLKH